VGNTTPESLSCTVVERLVTELPHIRDSEISSGSYRLARTCKFQEMRTVTKL